MVTPPSAVKVRLHLPPGAGSASPASPHPILVRGFGAPAGAERVPPVLVKRTESEFLPGLFADLTAGKNLTELGVPDAATQPAEFDQGLRRLFQPVHRALNLALIEAACARLGTPRLDPRNIVSAGCVVRRVIDANRPERDEAWLHRDGAVLGWVELGAGRDRLDPDPALRVRSALSVNPHVHARLAALLVPGFDGTEPVTPMFVAPPEVCQATNRTILYGIVPLASGETRTVARDETVDEDVVRIITPEFLQALGRNYTRLTPGGLIRASDVKDALAPKEDPPSPAAANLRQFVQELQLVASVWRPFENTTESRELLRRLNGLSVQMTPSGQSPVVRTPLGDYLGMALRRLLLQTEVDDLLVPYVWPQPDAITADGLRAAVRNSLQVRLKHDGPRLKRFDEEGATYRLHCFLRARRADGCPPELHWAEPSDPFRIVPWWDHSGTPVQTITLPAITRGSVSKLKPNVAFVMPPSLAGLLNGNAPKQLRDGEGQEAPGGIGWICSFSIPVITFCAFIVLNIFLSLFDLIFGWMFYLKICLPFPKVGSAPKP